MTAVALNEELRTVNARLQEKVTELSRANDDLINLFGATDIATVFVDGALRITRFTPAASRLLDLNPSDVGRPIGCLGHDLRQFDLAREVDVARHSGASVEKALRGRDGRYYVVRISPYQGKEKAPLGVVVTFIDVTTLKEAEGNLRKAREQLADDLRRMTRLQALSVEPLTPGDMTTVLSGVLGAALDVTGADMGNIQMADDKGVLTIAASSGLARPFLDFFARVDIHTDSVCGHALGTRRRTAIDNLGTSRLLAGSPALPVLQAAGIHAVQSTPLFGHTGTLIGMLSTHYRAPHTFTDAEARWLDQLAERATHLIERALLEQQLRVAKSKLEEQVKQVAERTRDLQVALDGAQAGTWRVDFRTNEATWDGRSSAILGAQPTGSLDMPFMHPDDRAKVAARLNEMAANGDDNTWDLEFRAVHPDGKVVTLRGIAQAERNEAGQLVALGGINLDVTADKEAQETLQKTRAAQQETTETLHRLLDAAVEGILWTTGDGVIENANAALETMFGYASGDLTGQPLEWLIPESWRTEHARQHQDFWAAPRSRPMGQGLDLVGRRKDGTTFPIDVSLTHIPTADGGRVLAFVTDITDRKRAENELRHSHAALQAQASELRHRTEQLRELASDLTITEQRAREQLARSIHDNLQQLLFSAKMNADRLAQNAARPGTLRDPSSVLDTTRAELEQAIEATRTLSIELFPPLIQSEGLATAIAWLATRMKEKYGLTVDVTADPRATIDKKDLRILAFESVRELLFDVVKHAQITRATLDLALTADDKIRITVADEGVGFDPAAVFSATARPAGWGLFSIRERAELLGGHLNVESAPGRGTRFTLVIPRSDTPADTRPRLRILIADDHAVARAGLREILSARPEFEIVGEASNGTEAMTLAQRLRPDTIIMDVAMPDMDGVEATRRIHMALPAVQILGLSTQERPEGLHAIEEAGAVGSFTMGDDAQKLIERLRAVHASQTKPV